MSVPGLGHTPLAHDGTWQSVPQHTDSEPYPPAASQPMSQFGGSVGQGDRLAEDIAVAKLPLAPVAHSAADTAATSAAAVLWPEAVLSVLRQTDQPSVQASAGLAHCLVPPHAP